MFAVSGEHEEFSLVGVKLQVGAGHPGLGAVQAVLESLNVESRGDFQIRDTSVSSYL